MARQSGHGRRLCIAWNKDASIWKIQASVVSGEAMNMGIGETCLAKFYLVCKKDCLHGQV
ncbi:hypothetical protein CCGE525_30485 (plasmid) [Rhizobium jaguaris]|uniref:Uncharacterized protein n=1 Tax=Rhizobium jaguaris TaxID=1312183 RepID=A0A387G411_9HYPH|nr:hypothetical protein CCGE525_30485 [Rhizobium jaguaris]